MATAPNGMPYSGNPDFRGYVAAVAPQYLPYVGNDINLVGSHGVNYGAIDKSTGGDGTKSGQMIGDINKLILGFSGYGGAGGGTGNGVVRGSATPVAPIDTAQLAQYDQSIGNLNSAVNRLGAQQASGNSTIDASYQNALNQLLLGKNQANADYTGNKTQTSKDYIQAKNTIGANAGNSLNGLLRLLGSKGAGGSSAYNISAPGAVAREATQERTGAGNTFGANNQALDSNWNNYLTGYNNQVSSANSQRDQDRADLAYKINDAHSNLLTSLAQLAGQRAQVAHGNATAASQPFLNQANALQDQMSNYHTNPISFQTQAYTAPSLSSYTTNPNAAPTVQGQTPTNDYTSPYLAALLKQKPGVAAPAVAGV